MSEEKQGQFPIRKRTRQSVELLDLDEMERVTDKHPDDRWGRLINLYRGAASERDHYRDLLKAAMNVLAQVDDEEGNGALDSLFDFDSAALDFWNTEMTA
jgi:hypothetical protein